ncbi:MAG: coproporphyrinogen III oxidase family protein [Chloroflexi bacterium]|nr:coproporphyrinogen III oxidase family protein [Chloroflexota bacterium]
MIINLATKIVRRFFAGNKQKFVFVKSEEIEMPALNKIDMYIHIPFCKSMCPYCPYNRIAYNKEMVAPYLEAILNEIDLYYQKFGKIEISSVYIGGGTPTNLIDELNIILNSLREKFFISGDICIETSPADFNEDIIKKLKNMGIDLISIGIQSFDDKYLNILGRKYDSKKAEEVVKLALSANFKSVNIDLMFVLPDQNSRNVLSDLSKASKLGVDQITTYPLFTFPYTSVGQYLKLNKIKMPNIIKRRKMYREIHDYCIENDYKQVSVWSFIKESTPRYSSVTRDTYIGIGAGACSSLPGIFYFNTFSVTDYINSALNKKLPAAITMDITSQLAKYYWLYWRFYDTKISKKKFEEIFAPKELKIKLLFSILKAMGLYKETKDEFVLTERGAFYIHLLQNYFVLNYINKVWTIAKREAWPKKIEI